ncbi:MAG: hypothetical protein BGO41_07695 [Clostridiales bacterium 38-18]|nr:MAG: hypothetical protein BGO41_07695 [Clostridiales bacterium 38-18]
MTVFKKYFPIVTYAILLFWGVMYYEVVGNLLSKLFSVLTPLIVGIAIAFVLNLLMKKIEKFVLSSKKLEKLHKKSRAISLLSTYLITLLVITLIIIFIVPQVAASAKTLIDKLPDYAVKLTDWGTDVYEDLNLSNDLTAQLFDNFKEIFVGLSSFTANTFIKVIDVTLGITSSALTTFMGIIFSAYILGQKEKLIRIVSDLNKALAPKKISKYLSELMQMTEKTFSRFVGGQLTEAMILGTLCFIGLILFKIPYAPLVSVLVAVTSLIPVVGAFIGTVPSVLIIAMESPSKALFFVIFIVILQQIEGNLIYPKVVGDAIGISGFWVFLAITVGGGLFGIPGMLLGVPLMAVVYSATSKAVKKRLNHNETASDRFKDS